MIFFLMFAGVLCLVYAWRRRQKYLEGRLPPVSWGAWPIVGHLHLWMRGLFWSRLLEIQMDCMKKGCVTYLYSGTNPTYTYYALCDPKDCTAVANECHAKSFLIEDSIRPIFGEGLATAPVSVWDKHRLLLESMFKQMCGSQVSICHAKKLIEKLNEKSGKGEFDQTEHLRQTVMRILFSIVFGVNEEDEFICRSNHIEEYQHAMQALSQVLYSRYRSYYMNKKLFFNLSRLKRRQDECIRVLKSVSNEIITAKRNVFNKDLPVTHPTCLLDALLTLEVQDVYSAQQITDEVNTTIYSGYETLVNSLTFILVMLGSHPEVQDKVYLEINRMLGSKKDDVETEDLTTLVYLEAVVMETLRLYPVVPTISRVVDSGIKIKKYPIKPGTRCLLFVYAMNRHTSWGEDRETFNPERWIDDSITDTCCASFGLGKRSCLGKEFSITLMKRILVYIVREYKITSDYTKMVIDHRIMLTPVSGHHVALERRKNDTEIVTIE